MRCCVVVVVGLGWIVVQWWKDLPTVSAHLRVVAVVRNEASVVLGVHNQLDKAED